MLATDTNNPKFSEFSDTEKFNISLPLLLNLVVAEVSVDRVSGVGDLAHARAHAHFFMSLALITDNNNKVQTFFCFLVSPHLCVGEN